METDLGSNPGSTVTASDASSTKWASYFPEEGVRLPAFPCFVTHSATELLAGARPGV